MKIQEVAARTGLSIHTLRYYEQIALVAPIAREGNSHRSYSEDDVYRIVFVTNLRAAGMPLAEIRRYVELSQEGDCTIADRLELLETHRRAVEGRIAELHTHLKRISGKIAHYRETYEAQLVERSDTPVGADGRATP
jgi:DNA-binding transcriptional MerR regulator